MQTAVTYWAVDNKSWSKLLNSRQSCVGGLLSLSSWEGVWEEGEKGEGREEKLPSPFYSLH